jgi:hypothetical protein
VSLGTYIQLTDLLTWDDGRTRDYRNLYRPSKGYSRWGVDNTVSICSRGNHDKAGFELTDTLDRGPSHNIENYITICPRQSDVTMLKSMPPRCPLIQQPTIVMHSSEVRHEKEAFRSAAHFAKLLFFFGCDWLLSSQWSRCVGVGENVMTKT